MIKADVPQDVTEYKEQFFFGMNSRQLICSVLMIVVAVLVFLVGSKFISTDILVYITIALIRKRTSAVRRWQRKRRRRILQKRS